MIAAGIVAGIGVGLGLLLLVYGLRPAREPLAQALERLLDPSAPAGGVIPVQAAAAGWRGRVTTRVAQGLAVAGADLGRLDGDLKVVGRELEEHLVDKVTAGLVATALAPGAVALMRLGGVGAPWSLAAVGALALGVAGFLLPDLLVRSQAAERRRSFRYALSSYLDLAHIVLAAGAGVETALGYAADAGEGWAFAELRAALHRSRLTGESPWSAFRRLGEELDIPELREVASSLDLAGSHGAKVRASLEARAQALRSRDLTEMEGEAEAATERMAVPSVLLVVGFVIFVGFPAVYQILGF